MCDHTLVIYCFIDDFLKACRHHEDSRSEVSDSEVLTIAVVAMLYFGGNFERSRLVLHELGLIKRLLSRSRFSRRLNRLTDLIHCLIHQLGQVLKHLHWETRYVLDSFPVPVCDNIRINRCRLVRDERYRGRIASKFVRLYQTGEIENQDKEESFCFEIETVSESFNDSFSNSSRIKPNSPLCVR
jgi:hypothetical protein